MSAHTEQEGTKIYYGTGVNAGGFDGQEWGSVGQSPALDGNLNLIRYSSGLYFNELPATWEMTYGGLYDHWNGDRDLKDVFLVAGSQVVQPTPYVSVSEDSVHGGGKLGQTTAITLDGQLTGEDYAALLSFENQIIQNFEKQLETFVITDNQQIVFARDFVRVDSINFSPSKYVNMVDYSIQLTANNNAKASPETHIPVYGNSEYVTDMEDSFSFSENGDGTASMTHSLSARGLPGARHSAVTVVIAKDVGFFATNKAKEWVYARRGNRPLGKTQVWPSFIPFESVPVLVGETQSEDHFNGTFSLTEEYLYNVYKSKSSAGTIGTWEEITYGIEHGTPVTATYSFAPAGTPYGPSICGGPGTTAETTSVLRAGTTDAFDAWSAMFHAAFPDAYDRGFRLNFQNKGVENSNTIPVQCVPDCGMYDLSAGSEAADANIGDFRIAEIGDASFAGCMTGPEDPGGWWGVKGAGGGDCVIVAGRYSADGAVGEYSAANHLMHHELGHGLGLGHDRDDSNLTSMSYAILNFRNILGHDSLPANLDDWYPDGPENHIQMLNQIRGMYGVGGYADRPVLTVTTSVEEAYPDDFAAISASVNLQGGQRWTNNELREYVKADKFWHPGIKGVPTVAGTTSDLESSAAAGTPSATADGSGPEYKSLFQLVRALSPVWIRDGLNPAPVSYSINEANSDVEAQSVSEISIEVTYDTNNIFGNTADSTALPLYEHPVSVLPFGPRHDSNAYFDYTVSIDTDDISNVTSVGIQGPIVARPHVADAHTISETPSATSAHNHLPFIDSTKMKLIAAQNFLDLITDLEYYLYIKANEVYACALGQCPSNLTDTYDAGEVANSTVLPCWPLNPRPESINVDKDPINGEISISASFSNKDWLKPAGEFAHLRNLDWNASIKPSLPRFERVASFNVNGINLIYDLGIIKREMIDISLKAQYHKDRSSLQQATDDTVRYMYSNYFLLKYNVNPMLIAAHNPKMTSENINYNENEGRIELKAAFSQEAADDAYHRQQRNKGGAAPIHYPRASAKIKGDYVN